MRGENGKNYNKTGSGRIEMTGNLSLIVYPFIDCNPHAGKL
jgi:hypothetical protein